MIKISLKIPYVYKEKRPEGNASSVNRTLCDMLAFSFLYTVRCILIFPISLLFFNHLILKRQGPSRNIFTSIKKNKICEHRNGNQET